MFQSRLRRVIAAARDGSPSWALNSRTGAKRTGDSSRRAAWRVVGYLPIWAISTGYTARAIDFTVVTDVAHFAVVPRGDGSLELPDWGPFPDPELLRVAHAAGARVVLVVGGDHEAARAGFSEMAGSAAARRTFAHAVIQLLDAHGYDGVDLDWEFPNSAVDRAGLSTLVVELRAAFGEHRTLSLAAPASDYFGRWFDIPALLPNVDWIGAMTYGLNGPSWSVRSGHNAPLFAATRGGADSLDALSVASGRTYYRSRGVPPEKLLLGLPFFGQRFDGANGLDQTLANRGGETLPYRSISRMMTDGWIPHRDQRARVPYLTAAAGSGLLSYDDPQSIRAKVAYSVAQGMGGVLIWSLGQDWTNGAQPLLQAVKDGLLPTPGGSLNGQSSDSSQLDQTG